MNNGDFIVQKCPSCGATVDLDENQDFGFCKYCGSKIIKKESIVQKVVVTNPIQIKGGVKIINNEFEVKLAKVDHEAQKFLEKPGIIVASIEDKAQKIISSYKQLENIGANEAKLWEHYLDFYIKVNMIKNIHLVTLKKFEATVIDIYNQILKYESDESIIEKYNVENIIYQFKEKNDEYIKEWKMLVVLCALVFLISWIIRVL